MIGLWLWTAKQSPETPKGWLLVAIVSIVAAGAWYGASWLLSVLFFGACAIVICKRRPGDHLYDLSRFHRYSDRGVGASIGAAMRVLGFGAGVLIGYMH